MWNDDRYYLVGYCEKHKDITVFRIDRIADISLTESIAIPCPSDILCVGVPVSGKNMYTISTRSS